MQNELVPGPGELALWLQAKPNGVIYHYDGGSQYLICV